jgi:signal transduction histidine kinase
VLTNALTFITAFVFVIAFVRLTTAAEQAQREAEQLAAELADANRRLGDYAVQAEELATHQERNRLAREIHDNLGHYLTVINVQIKAAQALLAKDPAQANAALEKAGRLAQEGLVAVRQSVSTLRDSPLGHRTLPEAVAALAAETQAAGVVAEFYLTGQPRPLGPRAELTLYRAAQEGLTNVRKHARASRVDLTLDYSEPSAVSLLVSDNGLGDTPDGPPGFGLLGLQERARQLGGQFSAEPGPDGGYRLLVTLPVTAGEPAGVAAAEGEVE